MLANTIVGLPEHALAFDRDNLTVSATTGLGFVGQSIEDFGYSADKLKNTNSGFLKYGGKSYYAGFSESENYWFVPVSERTSDNESLYTALRIAVIERGSSGKTTTLGGSRRAARRQGGHRGVGPEGAVPYRADPAALRDHKHRPYPAEAGL